MSRAPTVVFDLHDHRTGPVLDHDGGGCVAAVARHVGQRLLHDPVGSQVDARRERSRLPDDLGPHGQARGPGPGHEVVDVGEARGGSEGRPVVAVAEHVEHRAQLLQLLLARLLDGGQRRPGLLGMLVEEMEGDVGLDVDEGDVVGEHVVELPGDAQPLLARSLGAGPPPRGCAELRRPAPGGCEPPLRR
jgi:hypothetical protein